MIYMGGRGFYCYSLLPYCFGKFVTTLVLYFLRRIITSFLLKDISHLQLSVIMDVHRYLRFTVFS